MKQNEIIRFDFDRMQRRDQKFIQIIFLKEIMGNERKIEIVLWTTTDKLESIAYRLTFSLSFRFVFCFLSV